MEDLVARTNKKDIAKYETPETKIERLLESSSLVRKIDDLGFAYFLHDLRRVLDYIFDKVYSFTWDIEVIRKKLDKYNFPVDEDGLFQYGISLFLSGYRVLERSKPLRKDPESEAIGDEILDAIEK